MQILPIMGGEQLRLLVSAQPSALQRHLPSMSERQLLDVLPDVSGVALKRLWPLVNDDHLPGVLPHLSFEQLEELLLLFGVILYGIDNVTNLFVAIFAIVRVHLVIILVGAVLIDIIPWLVGLFIPGAVNLWLWSCDYFFGRSCLII